jgi:hypothetical protein
MCRVPLSMLQLQIRLPGLIFMYTVYTYFVFIFLYFGSLAQYFVRLLASAGAFYPIYMYIYYFLRHAKEKLLIREKRMLRSE